MAEAPLTATGSLRMYNLVEIRSLKNYVFLLTYVTDFVPDFLNTCYKVVQGSTVITETIIFRIYSPVFYI